MKRPWILLAYWLSAAAPLPLLAGGKKPVAAPPATAPSAGTAAAKFPDPEHETDQPGWQLPRLPVPHEAMSFRDPAIADLAGRIADGTADLRERRAWYLLSLNYAPFTELPPPNWRARAVVEGERISLAAKRRTRLAGNPATENLSAPHLPAPELPDAAYGWRSGLHQALVCLFVLRQAQRTDS